MKKFLSMFLVLVLAFSLAACSAGTQPTESTEATSPAEENKEVPAEEPITLRFTGWRTEDESAINAMNELFMAEYPNIKVVYEPVQATEYDTYLQTALANGTAADIIMMRSYSSGKTVFSGGKILGLNTENVPNLSMFPASAINAWASDGTSFAVPAGMTIEGVHYNKAIFDACGITKTPDTVEELLQDCQIIQDAGYLPIAGGISEAWYVSEEITSSILMATVGNSDWVKSLYAKEIDFTDPAYVTMLSTLQKLTAYYPDFYEGLRYEDSQNLFVTGQAAMYMSGSFELQYFTETNPDLQLGCFAFPGQMAAPAAINFTAAIGAGVYADSPNLEAALTYVNWLASKEGGEAYANGVLGFFSPNSEATALNNDLSKAWIGLTSGKETIHMLGYETMTESAPDYSTAVADTVYQMCVNHLAPEQAAAYMQQQMSWYFE